jgi:hypothetical protein
MIKFFRKIRQNLLMENKTGKYFKYAIGEIILVVIGILIALSINNWNENQKNKKQLDTIYAIIAQNLKTDLNNIKIPIEFYERLDSTLLNIMTKTYPTSFLDSINKQNYLDCIPCKSNHHIFEFFEIQDNGIELLKSYEDDESIEGSTLSQEILQFYTRQDNKISKVVDFIGKKAFSNVESLEQFPWYSDYDLKLYNRDAIAYFLNDQNYKNKVATFRNITSRNYLRNLKDYEKTAIDIISKIDKGRQ